MALLSFGQCPARAFQEIKSYGRPAEQARTSVPRRDVRLPGNVVIGGGRSGRWHRLGGKLVVAENNDYRLNAGGLREFAPDSPLEESAFEPLIPPREGTGYPPR